MALEETPIFLVKILSRRERSLAKALDVQKDRMIRMSLVKNLGLPAAHISLEGVNRLPSYIGEYLGVLAGYWKIRECPVIEMVQDCFRQLILQYYPSSHHS